MKGTPPPPFFLREDLCLDLDDEVGRLGEDGGVDWGVDFLLDMVVLLLLFLPVRLMDMFLD